MRRITTAAVLMALAALGANLPSDAQERRGAEIQRRFRQLDRDGDGKLTPEELTGMTQLLRMLEGADKNGDGGLSLEEVRAALSGGRRPPREAPRPPEKTPRRPTPESTVFEAVDVPGFTDLRGEANGLAFADFDRDGRIDIVRASNRARLTVLLNRGGFRFEPQAITVRNPDGSPGRVTPKPEIPNLIDFNRDGHLDLFITTSGGRGAFARRTGRRGNQLLVSDGSPFSFVDLTDRMGVLNGEAFNRQSSIADVNGDGWLDIAVGADNICDGSGGLPHSRLYLFRPKGERFEDGVFEDVGGTDLVAGFGGFHGNPDRDRAGPGIVLRDLDGDGDLDLVQGYHMDTWGRIEGEHPVAFYDYGVFCWKNLLKETGEFRFQRVEDNGLAQRGKLKIRAPFDYDVVEPAVALPFMSTGDIDNDGRLDVVAIGSCQPSFFAGWAAGVSGQLWRNRGGFRFEEATDARGLASLNWTNEQWLEFSGIPVTGTMRRSSDSPSLGKAARGWLGYKIYGGNAVFADFDNDGWLDLHVTNRKWSFPDRVFRNALYLNNGDGTFLLVKSEESGIVVNSLFAEAVDLDDDGLLDLVYARDPENNSPIVTDLAAREEVRQRFRRGGTKDYPEDLIHSMVLRNTGRFGGRENHWLRLRFAGVTDAELAGARVTVHEPVPDGTASGGLRGTRIVMSSHHHKSGTPLEAHFGLGKLDRVDVAVALWSGRRRVFARVKADRLVELDLANGEARPVPLAAVESSPANTPKLKLPSQMASDVLHASVVVGDLAKARRFYAEGLGLPGVGEPRRMPDGSEMHIFRAGASMLKVRVYDTPPPNPGGAIAAVNGIRFVGIPVVELDPILARLKTLGIPAGWVAKHGNRRAAVVADPDGTRIELMEAGRGASTRGIEIGLVVDDLAGARSFLGETLGLEPLPDRLSAVLPGRYEGRYALGRSVFRILAPTGKRPSPRGRPADAIGFRYITHGVRDVTVVHEALKAAGVEVAGAGRPVSYLRYSVFMAYGPGGALFEFVGPERSESRDAPRPRERRTPATTSADMALSLRFAAVDLDGDGRVTAREFPNRTIFAAFDRDGDGGITEVEFRALLGRTADRGPITPASALTPIGKQVDWFTFEKDYVPGTRDPNGQLLGGTELMCLAAHDGKLFAGTSMLKSDLMVKPYRDYPGPQILRKDTSDGPWVAERSFGRDHLRVNCLKVLTFTVDYRGERLRRPVSLLVAGLYDIRRGEKWTTVAVRDDETGTWIVSRIAPLEDQGHGFAGIRDLIVHGGEVFAAADFGGIYRGAYDADAPGRLRWVPEDEMRSGSYGRPHRMVVCDGVLYAAFGYSNQRDREKEGGLFRRIPGTMPRWERVYSWFDGEGPFEFLLRGLTTVVGPGGEPALLGALERPPLPVVRRIEPARGFAADDEVNYENYFANVFEAWPNVGIFMTVAALNEFTPFIRPEDGRSVHLVTSGVVHPQSPRAGFNGAYFLVRNGPDSYDWGVIADPANLPDGARLQGVRTIEPSPFPDEMGKVVYFGGFAADYAYVRDTAWIYKGTLRTGRGKDR